MAVEAEMLGQAIFTGVSNDAAPCHYSLLFTFIYMKENLEKMKLHISSNELLQLAIQYINQLLGCVIITVLFI